MNIKRELARLRRLTSAQLRQRYAEVFGEESRSWNKCYLLKRIAWRLQADAEGGLSERAKKRVVELAKDSDLRLTAPPQTKVLRFKPKRDNRLPMPGTVLIREYKGEEVRVLVLPQGFEFEGEVYRTLSAVARHITGSHLSGPAFFGLQKKGRKRDGR